MNMLDQYMPKAIITTHRQTCPNCHQVTLINDDETRGYCDNCGTWVLNNRVGNFFEDIE